MNVSVRGWFGALYLHLVGLKRFPENSLLGKLLSCLHVTMTRLYTIYELFRMPIYKAVYVSFEVPLEVDRFFA
jgi:hypothetical protein